MEETTPLLWNSDIVNGEPRPSARDVSKDIVLVDFDPSGDAENPMDWPKAYRWVIVGLLAFMAFTVYVLPWGNVPCADDFRTFTCISVVPIANKIVYDLDNGRLDKSASVLLVTIWELGEAAGPFLIAPLSELFGRYPVFNVANILFISAVILAALCETTPLFIASRALNGLAVASNVLNPAIVADIFPSEERGAAMSLIMLAPLTGGALGPTISGAIVQSSGWRNVIWMSVALAGACELVFLTCFRETYKVTILRRRAARLRKETGNSMLRTAFDADNDQTNLSAVWESVMRPTVVFCGSGVLQIMSLFGAVAFTYFYIMSTTLPDILEGMYHLQPAQMGSAFICFSKYLQACCSCAE
jgi:MFS family permease